jgi:Fe-S cluster assembly protein SufD
MVELMENRPDLQETFARFIESRRGAVGPSWLAAIRAAAIERFAELGFPTQRDEEWKFTNVAPIAKAGFALVERDSKISADQVRRLCIPELAGPQLVFVNGRFAPRLSSIGSLPRGLRVVPMVAAFETERDLIRPHLDGQSEKSLDAFGWLNTAFIEDGAFIRVAKGVSIEQPIHLLNVTATVAGGAPIMTHPRNLIVADEGGEVTVIEHYVATDDGVYFTNAVTDVQVGSDAQVHHYLIEQEGAEAFNVSTLRIQQMRDSRCDSHTVLLGGRLVRNNVHAILDGPGCDCLVNGLFVGSGSQHMDNHMRVEHAKPRCDSRQFYKGILDERASGVFAGRIIVHRDAQKTDAKQTNKNLLLSEDAHVDTKPQLEIYADDVKCTHGATIGQLDSEAIFYLRARGIADDAARSLLIHAFAGESLSRMKIEPVREYLDQILLRRLPGGELLESVL